MIFLLVTKILSRVNPDNVTDGSGGGIDTEALMSGLCVFLLIICLIMFIYIIYLHGKIDKLSEKKDNEEIK